jgi:hypothetical protein
MIDDTKYFKHIDDEPIPSTMRLVNVCICVAHNKEFLLGTRCRTCTDSVKRSTYILRKEPTLIRINENSKISGITDQSEQHSCTSKLKSDNHILQNKINKLETALTKISNWDQHNIKFSLDYGSNGERDLYRNIAKEALGNKL